MAVRISVERQIAARVAVCPDAAASCGVDPACIDDDAARYITWAAALSPQSSTTRIVRLATTALRRDGFPSAADSVAPIALSFCPTCAASGASCRIAALDLPPLVARHHRIVAAAAFSRRAVRAVTKRLCEAAAAR